MKNKTVAVSGYFNPLHIGHIRMFREAKKLGNWLIVIVNNDAQVALKGSVPFMKEEERIEIIKAIGCVDDVYLSADLDASVALTLSLIDVDIFANGGDRKNVNDIPETQVCVENNIEMVFNVGGKKIQSSSELCKKSQD